MSERRPHLIATSHGTDSIPGREAIASLVEAVRLRAPHLVVSEAFVDVQSPDLPTAVAGAEGPSVVVPLLLAAGFHVYVDIAEATAGPDVSAAAALGPDIRLAQVLMQRLEDAGATREDSVVLAGAGSSDERALASVAATARMLGALWGAPVPVGYLGGSGEPLREVVERARTAGRRVAIASYLMAPGFFFNKLNRVGADVVAQPLLGSGVPDARLVDIVLDRYEEASRATPPPADERVFHRSRAEISPLTSARMSRILSP
ncbi:hypothetical protein BH09ACT10_BH09ACT10_07090 [soil metagenome]